MMAKETTLGDRVEAALKAAGEQAMRNSNMGQVEAYRINHVISLVERERAASWKAAVQRCIAEVTGIWGADLVTTQAALDELMECRPE